MNPLSLSTRHLAVAAAALFLVGLVAVAIARPGGSGPEAAEPAAPARADSSPVAPPAAKSTSAPDRERPRRPQRPLPTLPEQPAKGPAYELVHLLGTAPVPLRSAPGGEVIAELGPETEFGSDIVVPVMERRRAWLAVQTPLVANREVGWIRHEPGKMELVWTKYALHVDLSARRLRITYGKANVSDHVVTVGASGSDTPTGRFAVTDSITFTDSPWYGCCALALNGHQTQLPLGWIGGDRIAIHGTDGGVGYAESHGCIRATDETMLELFERVPLGTPVFIRA